MKSLRFTTLTALSLSTFGCGAAVDPSEPDAQAESTSEAAEAVTSAAFYDVAEYMAPSCSSPVDLTFAGGGTRRYVPVGSRHNLPSFIYVKSPDGKDFEEYTVGRDWIRLWSDTSWAWYNGAVTPPYCDEICGAQGVPTGCYREWAGDQPPTAYAYSAPRDADNTNAGAKFMPRYIMRDDAPHAYASSGYIYAYQRSTSAPCANNSSWHSSPAAPTSGTSIVRHVGSYKGWSDLIMKVVTQGAGAGDRFWYARNYGFVGFEQINPSSSDMTSLDPSIAPVQYSSFASGSDGAGSAFPGANRAAFSLAQGSTCGAWDGPTIPLGSWISIRAQANNQFVCADNFGKSPLIANRSTVGDWEKFYVQDAGNGNVALKANANQEYVCADNFGASALLASRTSVGQWETYRWVDLGMNNFALQSASNGKYVTAENAGAQPLIASRDAIGTWETFHWDLPADGSSVWGVNSGNYLYRYVGGTQVFQQMPGQMAQVAVGGASTVWAVNAQDQIFRWNGSGWAQIAGGLKQISAAADGTVWGVNSGNYIYRYVGGTQVWQQMPGSLTQVAVGDANHVWGVNGGGQIYQWTGSTWSLIQGSLKNISVGVGG